MLSVRAFVSLDGLSPDDVQVQVVHGRVTPSDELGDTQSVALRQPESDEGGRPRVEGDQRLSRPGALG